MSASPSLDQERAELLGLLRSNGLLYASPTQPVLSRDGTSARWMLDSLQVTLTPRGGELAGRLLLQLLAQFDGRQLATYGTIGIPLLQSCILQSGGRYRGLIVRKEVKAHGSRKRIEGAIDPDEPVILVDDSVSSGTSMTEGCRFLEEAGLRVEGGVCLVRFGWYGGFARMLERGYRMAAVYDIWEDFIYQMPDEAAPCRNPTLVFPGLDWSSAVAAEGQHPALLARRAMEHFFATGLLLKPPAALDRDYDAAGGVWVSVRDREQVYDRHAREGFWFFDAGERRPLPEALVLAAVKTAQALPAAQDGRALLDRSSIAVTFFSALEECTVGDLDNDRYGIVVRSRERPAWMGGALPRMPGIGDAWQQFEHARRKNARLVSFEPYQLLRHEVVKLVEPGATWQPTGTPLPAGQPWHRDPDRGGQVARRAHELVQAALRQQPPAGEPLAPTLLPGELDSVFVTLYCHGQLRGCMGSVVRDVEADLRTMIQAALADRRFGPVLTASDADQVAVTASLLFDPIELGRYAPEEVIERVRLGQQALQVHQGERTGILLPSVAVTHNLNAIEFAYDVIDKAGITRPPYRWCRFECASWLCDRSGVRRIDGAFPVGAPQPNAGDQLRLMCELMPGYLQRHQREDGTLFATYQPCQNRLSGLLDIPRLSHAAWIMARAGRQLDDEQLRAAGQRTFDHLRQLCRDDDAGCTWLEAPAHEASVAELSFLLLAALEQGETASDLPGRLAHTLWQAIDRHGRVTTHREVGRSDDAFQDYFPGQLLLALAAATRSSLASGDQRRLDRAFRYYRHRFRVRPRWGMVSWHMQAWASWWQLQRSAECAAFVFEIGDWLLAHRQSAGGFINDHQPDGPGYTSALYLEGCAAALGLARQIGDQARSERYRGACRAALRFLDQLILQPRDAAVLPNTAFAGGGLRQSRYRSEVRVDFVQHALAAALALRQLGDL